MNNETIETVGKTVTVAGAAFLALQIIYVAIIKAKIIPQLTKDKGFRTVRLMVILTFVAVIVGIIAWAFGSNKAFSPQLNTLFIQSSADPQTQNIDNSTYNQNLKATQINQTYQISIPDIENNSETIDCVGMPNVPTFNDLRLMYVDVNAPLCAEYPVIDVALDIAGPKFSQSENEYNSVRKFNLGERIAALIYINNSATDKLDPKITTAKNVKVITSLTHQDNLYKLNVTFTADNAESKTGSVSIQVNSDEVLIIPPNTGYMYDYRGDQIPNIQNLDIGNSTLELGDLKSNFKYSLYFTYKLLVVKKS